METITQPEIPAMEDPGLEARTIRRVFGRLIPFIILLQMLNYLDRVNISFAQLTMGADLGLSKSVYGFGAGIFFVSYFLFEVPSNLAMNRFGARLWMARIMISWGVISSLMLLTKGPLSFYVLRFLLGTAEAGFAPGILLYLTWWLPLREQARAVALFLAAIALSGIIGSPLAGLLLRLNGAALLGHPLAGWQWLFLLEGVPSVLAGLAVLFWLTDRPEQAAWLEPAQRAWLGRRMAEERRARQGMGHTSLGEAFASGRVWLLSLIYALLMFALQIFNFWLATIIKQVTGVADNFHVGLLTAIPFVAAAISMVAVGRHSDRRGERRGHVAACVGLSSLALLACACTSHPVAVIALLALAAGGIFSSLGPFWALPPAFLGGTAAAAGIAIINSIGNLGGGFVGPYVMGVLQDKTHGYQLGLAVVAADLLLAGALTLTLRRRAAPRG